MPQGRPQVVRHRVTESFQFLVGGFQLRGPQLHFFFQLIVEFQNFYFGCLSLGDVARDFCYPNNRAAAVLDRRNRRGNVYPLAILSYSDGFEMIDAFPARNSRQDVGFLSRALQGQEPVHRFAHRLCGRVAEQPLGAGIPRGHHPIQGLADDGVVGGLDHGRQVFAHFLQPLACRDVGADGDVLARLTPGVEERNGGRGYPEDGAVLGPVPNFAVPNPALPEGVVHLLEKLFRMVAGIHDAVIPANGFLPGIQIDGAESIVDISDRPVTATMAC